MVCPLGLWNSCSRNIHWCFSKAISAANFHFWKHLRGVCGSLRRRKSRCLRLRGGTTFLKGMSSSQIPSSTKDQISDALSRYNRIANTTLYIFSSFLRCRSWHCEDGTNRVAWAVLLSIRTPMPLKAKKYFRGSKRHFESSSSTEARVMMLRIWSDGM